MLRGIVRNASRGGPSVQILARTLAVAFLVLGTSSVAYAPGARDTAAHSGPRRVRSRGYGRRMLDWLKTEARRHDCSELQLISRVVREQAHRFYLREGFGIECFQFRTKL